MPETWLSTIAGLQVPVILLVDLVVNTGAGILIHTDWWVSKENCGVINGFTVTVTVKGGAQGSDVLLNV